MIEARALTRTYGDIAAVRDVSFSIAKREIVALLGPNGAGKSTLMKMITGYLEPTSGQVKINGLDVWADRQEVQKQIGYLPENCPLYSDMTAVEYLDYAADLRGVEANNKAERLKFAIAKTNLGDVVKKRVVALSRGFRQRLGVAQALLSSPEILILDEPTNGLDPTQIIEMRSLIRELAESATVLISTHNLQEVRAVSSRVIIIARGKIALDQPLLDLQNTHRVELVTDADLASCESSLSKIGCLKIIEEAKLGAQMHFTIELQASSDYSETAALITKTLIENGFKVFELKAAVGDLEEIFANITQANNGTQNSLETRSEKEIE